MERYLDTFKRAESVHKILYFLPMLLFIAALAVLLGFYIDATVDMYYVYERRGLTTAFIITWGVVSILMFGVALLNLLVDAEQNFFALVVTEDLRELMFLSLCGIPLAAAIFGFLPMMCFLAIPYFILEYWEVSRIILSIILLLILISLIVAFFTKETEGARVKSASYQSSDSKKEHERDNVSKKTSAVSGFFYSVLLSTTSAVLTYLITHTLFGFGTLEASLGSVLAAIILGSLGYKA